MKMTNNIAFTSRINFVNAKTFENFRCGTYIDFRKGCEIVTPKFPRPDIYKTNEFYTEEVRTCTAGGVIDSKNGECLGFHIYDNLINEENADSIIENIFKLIPNPDKALLLGSKQLTCAKYSLPIFKKIYEGLSSRIKNITVFREHTLPISESNLHYSLKNDTWTVHSMYTELLNLKEHHILSENELQKCFKEVILSPDDTINFDKLV